MSLIGFVTERDREAIEESFPGIWSYYEALSVKPATFLELMWGFLQRPLGDSDGNDRERDTDCEADRHDRVFAGSALRS